MRPNTVKQKLHAGQTVIGTMIFEFASTGIVRIAGVAGAEFVLFDMEHNGWTMETIRLLVATTPANGPIPMVRIPATEYHFLARVLDVGAMGVMVPMVESAEQARQVVQFARYPPAGRRGAAFGFAHDDYVPGDNLAKMQSANDNVLLIAQIETAAGLANVDAIAAVPGIDVLWVGHNDLTNSLGIPGQFEHPTYLDGVRRVVASCRKHHKTAGFMATGLIQAQAMLALGFRVLSYGGDIGLYRQALADGIAALRLP